MKHSLFKISILTLIFVLVEASVVFADSINDNKEIKSFKEELESFDKQYDKLRAELELAYDKNDAIAYREAKRALANLERPVLTEEKSSKIEKSLKDDEYEAANWLYRNSNFYTPSIEFKSEGENFNYHQTFTANPGTNVTVPYIRAPRTKIFKGWGFDEKAVVYEAGSTIKMPVKDVTLFAVFEDDPEIVTGNSILISGKQIKGSEDLSIKRSEQTTFKFDVKNNGSEDLSGLTIKFDSEDPLLVVLSDTLNCRYLKSGDEGTAGFRLITKAASGSQLCGTITIEDSNNHVWTEDVVFSVK